MFNPKREFTEEPVASKSGILVLNNVSHPVSVDNLGCQISDLRIYAGPSQEREDEKQSLQDISESMRNAVETGNSTEEKTLLASSEQDVSGIIYEPVASKSGILVLNSVSHPVSVDNLSCQISYLRICAGPSQEREDEKQSLQDISESMRHAVETGNSTEEKTSLASSEQDVSGIIYANTGEELFINKMRDFLWSLKGINQYLQGDPVEGPFLDKMRLVYRSLTSINVCPDKIMSSYMHYTIKDLQKNEHPYSAGRIFEFDDSRNNC